MCEDSQGRACFFILGCWRGNSSVFSNQEDQNTSSCLRPTLRIVFILYANLPHHKWIFPDMAYFNTLTTNHQGFTSPPPHLYDLLHFSREAADDVRVLLLHVLLTLGTGNDTSINEFFKYISTKHSSGFVKQPSKKRNANGSDYKI